MPAAAADAEDAWQRHVQTAAPVVTAHEHARSNFLAGYTAQGAASTATAAAANAAVDDDAGADATTTAPTRALDLVGRLTKATAAIADYRVHRWEWHRLEEGSKRDHLETSEPPAPPPDEAGLSSLPAALRDFEPLEEHPDVAELTTGAAADELRALEAAIQDNPDNADEQLATLRTKAAAIRKATDRVVVEMTAARGLFLQCYTVSKAGDAAFSGVYGAVWHVVELAEPDGIKAYTVSVAAMLASTKASGECNRQQLPDGADVADLYRAAAAAKPGHDEAMRNMVAELRAKKVGIASGGFKLPKTLKKSSRVIEKTALVAGVADVTDVVRSMLVVNSMEDVVKVIEALRANPAVVVVRVKDRFVGSPSSGGWRDLMAGDAFRSISARFLLTPLFFFFFGFGARLWYRSESYPNGGVAAICNHPLGLLGAQK